MTKAKTNTKTNTKNSLQATELKAAQLGAVTGGFSLGLTNN